MVNLIFKRPVFLGGGWIGAGFAIRAAKYGCEVMIRETPEAIEKAKKALKARLQQAVDKKKLTPEKCDAILERIHWSTDFNMACSEFGPDILIDATTEDKAVKIEALKSADEYLPEGVPRVTGTSALDGEKIGFDAGFHPMSPVEINNGLELVLYKNTSPELAENLWQWSVQLGLVPILVDGNQPGFVVNGLFVPLLLKGCEMLAEGFNIPTIEKALIVAAGIRVGPFKLMNFTGVGIAKLAAVPMQALGPWLTIPKNLSDQIDSGENWDMSGESDDDEVGALADRFRGLIFANALRVVPDVHRGWHDLNRLFRICLKWLKGPGELMHDLGEEQVGKLVQEYLDANPSFPKVELPENFDDLIETQWWLVKINEETSVAKLTLDCPEHMGALSSAKLAELAQRIKELEANDKCRICLVESTCGNFAGANIKELLALAKDEENPDGIASHLSNGCDTFGMFRDSRILFIGVVRGKFVLGGGAELVLSLDFKFATDTTGFGFPEPKAIGGVPGWNGILNLVRDVGRVKAATVLLQPWKVFRGQKAVDLGFVNEVFKADELDDGLTEFIEGLQKCSPDALAAQKRLLWFAADLYQNSEDDIESAVTDEMNRLLVGEDAINRMTEFAGGKKKAVKR